ncbi:MAG: hypothetical protein ACTSP4_00730 [Candidatus Hodarchaeales archaeon]
MIKVKSKYVKMIYDLCEKHGKQVNEKESGDRSLFSSRIDLHWNAKTLAISNGSFNVLTIDSVGWKEMYYKVLWCFESKEY